MKTRFIMRPCYCDRLVKAIDNYIQKADNDLSDLLGKEGYCQNQSQRRVQRFYCCAAGQPEHQHL